ncbi:cholesteryl ester transfer protein isoform X3 [Osmerus mordax]|uniref:cholesteryl ester transfer protein isoform X3 n=1 Tax=Osmerus mordax TaxID=8014 RepID=UPI00350EC986
MMLMDRYGKVLCVALVSLVMLGFTQACLDPQSAYRFSGAVCRLTYPAAVVLNEKTTKVIETAFQHAKYPSVEGEKSLLFTGTIKYGLENLEIHNLSIGQSLFELQPGVGIAMEIRNVSAVFRGTIKYGYGSWLFKLAHSIDFEIESQIDLGINPKLYCGKGKVAADTSDCFLNFHKLRLHLQGDREPGWMKRLFTEFITFTVKLVVKSQICKEINNVANILADFIQERAEKFLSYGNISVDIGVTSAPVITADYIESYHKGLTNYNNVTAVINASVFDPSHLTEDRMLYFWLSDEFLNPVMTAAHQDGLLRLNISGPELNELFRTDLSSPMPEVLSKEVEVIVTASYSEKKVYLKAMSSQTSVLKASLLPDVLQLDKAHFEYFKEAVQKIGLPKVLSVLEPVITGLLDEQGTYLFDIIDPQVIPQDGYVVVQMDFGFPHHLLVEFLRKTLE